MAFSDYKSISHVQRDFKVRYQEETFLAAQDLQPSATFLEEFRFSMDNIDVYTSEASRAEAIIFPILREVYKHYYERYSFWVQKALTVDEKLNGTPDYLIGTKSALGKTFLETPLVIIAEAKKNDFEQGWGQCLAELIAAQKLNRNTRLTVHGIVTDGRVWDFGKLREDVFTKNAELYTVDHLASLFGALHAVFQAAAVPKPARKSNSKAKPSAKQRGGKQIR
jgi:nicotinic acid phosphoribosyltransferase